MQNQKGKILLLEDNKKLLKANVFHLQGNDREIYAAATIAQAREILKTVTPDLAVLDVKLPDGNGLDFAVELHKLCKTAIIFLSAKDDRKDILAGHEAGAIQYITKPYDTEIFKHTIINALNHIIKLRTPSPVSLLRKRDIDIARLVIKGKSNNEIAAAIFRSKSCVRGRLTKIYKKLGIANLDDLEKRKKLAEILGELSEP